MYSIYKNCDTIYFKSYIYSGSLEIVSGVPDMDLYLIWCNMGGEGLSELGG